MTDRNTKSPEEVSGEGDTTTIKTFDKDDSHIEIVSGHKSIEEFETIQEVCHTCGLVARSKTELQDHVHNTHREEEEARRENYQQLPGEERGEVKKVW